ncbi:MAG: carbohydrate kinase family protein [Candidatus Saccharimonadales bacterium]
MQLAKTVKITTIGAAVQDVFLMGEVLRARRDVRTHDFVEQFPLGAKLELDKVIFDTGGGATNAAVTFARHGFETQFLGKIGDDPAGAHILQDLQREGVKTGRIKCDLDGTTGYSTLLLAPRGERTVLVYRGVSQELSADDFDNFARLKTDWLYVSSLSGNFPLLEAIVAFAQKSDVKLAINPGSAELKQAARLKKLLPNFAVVSLNKEEAGELSEAKTSAQRAADIARLADIAVVTDGAKGSAASDGTSIYQAGLYEDTPVLDRTGAGDAFTSGFVASIARGTDIPTALTFASANSTSVVGQIGAKAGILTATAKYKKMEIRETKINTQKAPDA